MKSKKEIKQWLLENCVDGDGDLELSDLDFSDFNGNVWISYMRVKGDLIQNHQNVKGNLNQNNQFVGVNLFQHSSKYGVNLFQGDNIKKTATLSKEEFLKQNEDKLYNEYLKSMEE